MKEKTTIRLRTLLKPKKTFVKLGAHKRCGHVAGKAVIPLAEMARKIRAGDRARRELDTHFLLIARGVAGGSVDEFEEEFLPADDVAKKYAGAIGFQP